MARRARFSRSRFSPITNGYVLPPGEVFAALIYEGDAFMRRQTRPHLTQEIEIGLPYRFGLAIENSIEHFNGDTENSSFSIEGRWALADWGKIPLNPTLFAEYKFGTGKILHEEGPPAAARRSGRRRTVHRIGRTPMSSGSSFPRRSRRTSNGPSTPSSKRKTPATAAANGASRRASRCRSSCPRERFKAGLEMKYHNFTVKDTRGDHRCTALSSGRALPLSRPRGCVSISRRSSA